ncbi:nucleotidyltransferase domain-containing protein [Paenibacillus sp. P96]|uniref:Nucleotidyltransferase domain-containing protein n=1 Tax=Paenibacillus zeirhizosphaerae TaxID=2987519 RepID=A0ABT9FRK7_9BACL|nr:nucleotidyltransferase domain-containing protein [Paenibacillus sp. P96]MDP4097366.1 nucleotidyltransferase domain-containing protein [Paenibacillus sp. P96]
MQNRKLDESLMKEIRGILKNYGYKNPVSLDFVNSTLAESTDLESPGDIKDSKIGVTGFPSQMDLIDFEVGLKFTEEVKNLFGENLLKVILFGSRARGEAGKHSDYDFMVLVKSSEIDSWPLRAVELKKRVYADFPPMDIMVLTLEEFKNKFFFREAVEKEGVVFFGQTD